MFASVIFFQCWLPFTHMPHKILFACYSLNMACICILVHTTQFAYQMKMAVFKEGDLKILGKRRGKKLNGFSKRPSPMHCRDCKTKIKSWGNLRMARHNENVYFGKKHGKIFLHSCEKCQEAPFYKWAHIIFESVTVHLYVFHVLGLLIVANET